MTVKQGAQVPRSSDGDTSHAVPHTQDLLEPRFLGIFRPLEIGCLADAIIQWFPNDILKQSWKSGVIFQILESKQLGTGKKFNVTSSSIVNFVDEENKIVSGLAVLGS